MHSKNLSPPGRHVPIEDTGLVQGYDVTDVAVDVDVDVDMDANADSSNSNGNHPGSDAIEGATDAKAAATTGASAETGYGANYGKERPRTSQYTGVTAVCSNASPSVQKRVVGYQAHILYEGNNQYLGKYPTEKEAAMAYDIAVRQYWGPNSNKCNFPLSNNSEDEAKANANANANAIAKPKSRPQSQMCYGAFEVD